MKDHQNSPPAYDLASVRAKLKGVHGQQYWRSLDELAETKEFKEMLHREFPAGASEWLDSVSRRDFLKLASASLALAGLSACTKQPVHQILPYVKQPERMVLGEPLFYATAMVLGGFATGVLVKSREGHPIKIEGNPNHPSSLGASSLWMQASLLDLYDPNRSQTVAHNGDISTWSRFLADVNNVAREEKAARGAGLRFLTETVTSPTLASQLRELLREFPEAKWHQFDPISRDSVREGAQLAFGKVLETHYQFDKASVILALDSDFLYSHPERLRYTRAFTDGRRVNAGNPAMNRLYVVEPTPTVTGTMADHRLPLSSLEIETFIRKLARTLGVPVAASPQQLSAPQAQWLEVVARDLQQHQGAGAITVGETQPAIVHALAHFMNQALGNSGKTMFYTDSAEANPINQLESFRDLVKDIKAGLVNTLSILGGNPVYTAPADFEFGAQLAKVKRSIHLGLALDETGALCTWHIPQTHYLESWGDARAFDGTCSLIQPLIAPLYGGKSAHELLDVLAQQQSVRSDYEIVRTYWQAQDLWPDFEEGWRRALHDGVIAGTEFPPKNASLKADFIPTVRAQPALAEGALEINFRPDPNLWDGQFANNGWLQECPKPITKLTWDNAFLISPALAQRLGLSTDDLVEIRLQDRTLRAPVWILPGQASRSITLNLGYGRTRVGPVGEGIGSNGYTVRGSDSFWTATGFQLTKTAGRHHLVATQTHHNVHSPERQIFRTGTFQEYQTRPDFVRLSTDTPPPEKTLYDPQEFPYAGYKWGMSIDLNTCIGCNSCLVACEVENNIPVVGRDQVNRNREMFWIRIDTYYKGSIDNPEYYNMPVPCMHCEHAPCELVCPVAATVHDHEGLNLQVYNRCVGTRFCSNNCPYKVRRFNFLRYTDYETPAFKPMYNPEVTVRWRGVMEKCTYCVQRISGARIKAEKENRRIKDGEVKSACQQACPAQAIIFGDLNDRESQVVRAKNQPLDYSMLGELNTRPRTTYSARLQNPNPALALPAPA